MFHNASKFLFFSFLIIIYPKVVNTCIFCNNWVLFMTLWEQKYVGKEYYYHNHCILVKSFNANTTTKIRIHSLIHYLYHSSYKSFLNNWTICALCLTLVFIFLCKKRNMYNIKTIFHLISSKQFSNKWFTWIQETKKRRRLSYIKPEN